MPKTYLKKRTGFGTFKKIVMHPKARDILSRFPEDVRYETGFLLYRLQLGDVLPMPQSKPMKNIAVGAQELRVRGEDGNYRVFYYAKTDEGILVFHAFMKKTQKTSQSDIELGRKRLKEMLEG